MEFQCTFGDAEGDRTLYLRAASIQDKKVWVSALQEVVSKAAASGSVAGRRQTIVQQENTAPSSTGSMDAESLRARSVAANHQRELREAAQAEKVRHHREIEQHWHDAMATLAQCVGVDAPPPSLLTAEQLDSVRGERGEEGVARLVSHRNRMIFELISTERTYGKGLRSILVNYYAPMTRGDVKDLVNPSTCRMIFANLNQVAQAQCTLQAKLDAAWEAAEAAKKAAPQSDVKVISVLPFLHALLHVLPTFHVYEKYVSNFDNASKQVKLLEVRPGTASRKFCSTLLTAGGCIVLLHVGRC